MLTTKGHKKERKFKCGTTIVRTQKKKQKIKEQLIFQLFFYC